MIAPDGVIIGLLARLYFPLSVGWDEVLSRAPSRDDGWAARRIRRMAATYAEVEARWEQAFFGEGAGDGPDGGRRLARLEAERHRTAHAWASTRICLLARHLGRRWPGVRFRIPRPEEPPAEPPVQALPETGPVEQSAAFTRRGRRISFLRYPSADPLRPQPVYARVVEPATGPVDLTVLYCHGIGTESEIWRVGREIESGFARIHASGGGAVRLVMLEGPGHGRRRTQGWYAGERVLALGPHALAGYLNASAEEIHLLTLDARRRWPGTPVAFLGTSLGALTMEGAVHPRHARGPAGLPDAVCLVTPAADVRLAVFEGDLTGSLGVPGALIAAGWSRERMAELTDGVDPPAEPPLDPGRLVMKIGARDRVLLPENGRELARRWRLPARNVLYASGGHFASQLEIPRNPAVLARLIAVATGG